MKYLAIFFFWFITCSILLTASIFAIYKSREVAKQASDAAINLSTNTDIIQITPVSFPIIAAPGKDHRILVLQKFLNDYRSPLAPYAEEIVKQADLQGISYTFIPAIAMQESGGCKVIPDNSYNCWGFGIYGDKVVRFASYEEGIARVSKIVKEAYIKNGLTNATLVEDKWTPSSKGNWSYSVNFFIGKIKEYEQNLPAS